MWNFGNLARGHRHHRRHHYGYYNRAEGMATSTKTQMQNAAIYKGAAVVTAGLAGWIGAYKGLPEASGTAGLVAADSVGGLVLSGIEFWMIMKNKSGRATALVGGVSTGLLCHFAAVQGTMIGAGRARLEGAMSHPSYSQTDVGGFNYNQQDSGALPQAYNMPQAQVGASFDPHYGMI